MTNEAYRITSNLCSASWYKSGPIERKLAKEILSQGWPFCNGEIRDVKAKSVGLGLYEVYTVKRKL